MVDAVVAELEDTQGLEPWNTTNVVRFQAPFAASHGYWSTIMNQSPSFKSPPVVEVVLTAQFDPIPEFSNSHQGLFWALLGTDNWPKAEDLPPLSQQFERFGTDQQWSQIGTFQIGLSQKPSSRTRIINAARNRIIQLQNGRVSYHWIGTEGEEYPRYEKIRDEAAKLFQKLVDFLRQSGLGEIHLNQWEVVYANSIPRGTVWNEPEDWTKVFNSNAMLPAAVGSHKLENFGGEWTYGISENRGRLHVELHSARDMQGKDILLLKLTARGPAIEDAGSDVVSRVLAGLKIGRETIVNGFRDLTSQEARSYWEEVT